MSYDIAIYLPQKEKRTKIANHINKLEQVTDLRFIVGDKMYMEIDLESTQSDQEDDIDQILFHIPYTYLGYSNVDFDLYFEFIKKLAEDFNAQTEDLQLNTPLDSEKFALNKPLLINTAVQLSQITLEHNELIVHSAYRAFQYKWDLQSGGYKGSEFTGKEITNYECYNKHIENDVWKIESGQKCLQVVHKGTGEQRIIKRTGQVVRLVWLDEHRLLTASSNKSIKLWDLTTGKALATFKGHSDAISDIAPLDKETLISSSIDGSLRFWEISTGKLLFLLLHSYYDDAWIMISANGDYHHSGNYKGSIRWGFGKEVYEIGKGQGFDSKGSWNYTFDESKKGVKVNELFLKKLL